MSFLNFSSAVSIVAVLLCGCDPKTNFSITLQDNWEVLSPLSDMLGLLDVWMWYGGWRKGEEKMGHNRLLPGTKKMRKKSKMLVITVSLRSAPFWGWIGGKWDVILRNWEVGMRISHREMEWAQQAQHIQMCSGEITETLRHVVNMSNWDSFMCKRYRGHTANRRDSGHGLKRQLSWGRSLRQRVTQPFLW